MVHNKAYEPDEFSKKSQKVFCDFWVIHDFRKNLSAFICLKSSKFLTLHNYQYFINLSTSRPTVTVKGNNLQRIKRRDRKSK